MLPGAVDIGHQDNPIPSSLGGRIDVMWRYIHPHALRIHVRQRKRTLAPTKIEGSPCFLPLCSHLVAPEKSGRRFGKNLGKGNGKRTSFFDYFSEGAG